jgi:hypothetical protein
LFYTIKYAGGPPKPGLGPKIEARCAQWVGHGQDFFPRNNRIFSARPEKCSGLREKYRWLVAICFERKVLLAGGL